MSRLLRTPSIVQNRSTICIFFKLNLKLRFSTKGPLSAGQSPSARSHQSARQRQLLREGSKVSTNNYAESPIQENWPLHLIEASSKSGGLPIKAQAAVMLLNDFQSLARRPTSSSIQGLCLSNTS